MSDPEREIIALYALVRNELESRLSSFRQVWERGDDCDILAECGGGCRYRAELMTGAGGPDPLMCARMGRPWH